MPLMRNVAAAWCAAGALWVAMPAQGSGEHAHSDAHAPHHQTAHQHGVGLVNVAVDGNALMLEFQLPAMDVVGFEHTPGTDQERQTVNTVAYDLKHRVLVRPSRSAHCSPAEVALASPLLGGAAPADHDHHHDEHADVRLTLQSMCAQPGQLSELDFSPLFSTLPTLKTLTVQLVTDRGQRGGEVSTAQPRVRLP